MSLNGYIKIHRKILESRVFNNAELLRVWMWCLLRANHKRTWVTVSTGRGETEVELQPGQFIFGRKAAAKELGLSESTIRNRMEKLKNMQNVTIQPDTHYSIVSVNNWDSYQSIEIKKDRQSTNQRTTKGQPKDTDKNDKNDKNNKGKLTLPDWLDSDIWKDFKDHRKKLRKPMTQKAEEILIKKLEHLKEKGHKPRHLIITAIERGWQTVYEPKA